MKGKTILIGTNHIDPRGPQRLEKLLEHLEPEILTVESSDERVEAYEKQKEKIRSAAVQVGKQLIEEWFTTFSPPYEVYIPGDYSKKHNIPLHKIDTPYLLPIEKKRRERGLEAWSSTTEESVRTALLKWKQLSVNPGMLEGFDDLQYDTSRLIAANRNVEPGGILGTRDEYMVKRIKQIRKQNPDSKIVHVGGAQHMVLYKAERKVTMYYLMPESEVYFLPEADLIGQ